MTRPNTINARYMKSQAMLERALKVIPLGSQTFSKSYTQYPEGQSPLFLTHGKGGRVWDVDGNEYVDLVSALLPVVLGYGDPDVDRAIKDQLERGISFSLGTELEIELAERLVEIIPCAEMVRFGKNGSDATSAAIRLARAHTGRDRVAVCGYHGWHDWYIGATVRNRGIPACVGELTHRFVFNDIDSLKALLDRHPGEFAAVIMEVVGAEEPRPGFIEDVRSLIHKHGGLLIFDEIVTGFRVALGGAQQRYGITPDLAAFGKAMGNGMPIAAVVGSAKVMREMEEVFVSGTFGGEALSLAAAIATIDKLRREKVADHLWRVGSMMQQAVSERIKRLGLEQAITVTGLPAWPLHVVKDHPNASKEAIRTLFTREMLLRGVLQSGSMNFSLAHTERDFADVLSAYDGALSVLAEELARPGLETRLDCPVLHPVFSVRSR